MSQPLSEMGDSAVLPLLELEQRPDLRPAFRERVQVVRANLLERLEEGQVAGWTLLGQWRLEQARQRLAGQAPVRIARGPRGCDGDLLPPMEPIMPPARVTPAPPAPVTTPAPALTGASGK